jgi:peptidoglycan hydrolase-like protein with peptidoglycan-binding domain
MLNQEQRTRVREAIESNRNVPRVNSINFGMEVGAVVPAYVPIAPLPAALIEVHPEWRGYEYFVYEDDVVVVNREHHIVATVPYGTSRASTEYRAGVAGGSAAGGGFVFNGSVTEIREVQEALIHQGFNIGEVDGVMGPRTREALMAFQRQRGFRPTGEIDQQTFAALDIRAQGNVGGGNQPYTTGQGAQQGNTQQAPANAREPAGNAREPGNAQQPLANQPANRQGSSAPNQPATTGQAGSQNANPANPGNRGTAAPAGGLNNQPGALNQNQGTNATPSATSPQNRGSNTAAPH